MSTATETTAQPTIEVEGYFGPKRVTREKFIQTWVNHASELSNIMALGSFVENVRESAGNRFDEIYAREIATA